MKSDIPAELLRVCEEWGRQLVRFSEDNDRMAYISDALTRLLANQTLFQKILQNIASGAPYPDTHRTTLFPNEMLLYLQENRVFSLRMLLAEPGAYTPIHDHNAWGVITPFFGELNVIGYERVKSQSEDRFSGLREILHKTLHFGETCQVLPLNEGIHKTGNSGEETLVMISVYGQPIRRPYVLGYDLEQEKVFRIYTPRTRKKMLAKDALKQLWVAP